MNVDDFHSKKKLGLMHAWTESWVYCENRREEKTIYVNTKKNGTSNQNRRKANKETEEMTLIIDFFCVILYNGRVARSMTGMYSGDVNIFNLMET